jgi:hypothetical protein
MIELAGHLHRNWVKRHQFDSGLLLLAYLFLSFHLRIIKAINLKIGSGLRVLK